MEDRLDKSNNCFQNFGEKLSVGSSNVLNRVSKYGSCPKT